MFIFVFVFVLTNEYCITRNNNSQHHTKVSTTLRANLMAEYGNKIRVSTLYGKVATKLKYKCVAVEDLRRRLYNATKCCQLKKIDKEEQKEKRKRKREAVIK